MYLVKKCVKIKFLKMPVILKNYYRICDLIWKKIINCVENVNWYVHFQVLLSSLSFFWFWCWFLCLITIFYFSTVVTSTIFACKIPYQSLFSATTRTTAICLTAAAIMFNSWGEPGGSVISTGIKLFSLISQSKFVGFKKLSPFSHICSWRCNLFKCCVNISSVDELLLTMETFFYCDGH